MSEGGGDGLIWFECRFLRINFTAGFADCTWCFALG